ncbi:MAG: class I SAM-dependent methyltransferase [Flavobacteriaceae bacterium]|jgi:SAM-dependent methyltransferase|nr:class I SAM-dependent methyltransferase [Flavobacteriaceae bacterium]
MYIIFKNILRKILPQKFLFKNEMIIRKILYLFYKGKNCECNICNSKLRHFQKLKNGDILCPVCGSLPRTRRLFKLLNSEFLKPNFSVLEFSPHRIMYRNLKKRKDILYFPTDFENQFLADYHFDITKIDAESEKFDLIICYHVLEHIENDDAAMKELYRVLKTGGTALIQTPFKSGNIFENPEIKTPEERLRHFGQEDHVRIYTAEILSEKLKNAGFSVEIRVFEKDDYYGLSENERIIVCGKNQAAAFNG